VAESLTIDFGKPLPLFPLGATVLLPHATVPLHIFEPRYRELMRDTLGAQSLIAMATFAGEDWKLDYAGNPPLLGHVCVGYVIKHDQTADGRYNLLLQGICRARIRKELPHQPYRIALLEPTENRDVMDIDLEDERQRLDSLLNDEVLRQLASVKAVGQWASREVPTAALIDLAILAMANRSADRYAMLEESDAHRRARWLTQHLEAARRSLHVASSFGSGKSEDGWCLN
jgi:Lon protease-like protein